MVTEKNMNMHKRIDERITKNVQRISVGKIIIIKKNVVEKIEGKNKRTYYVSRRDTTNVSH
jgi:hypothetical protein